MSALKSQRKNKPIILVGARLDGHAGVVIDMLDVINDYKLVGFIDNTPELQNKLINGIPVIGSTDDLDSLRISARYFHIAIGDNVARGNLLKRLKQKGLKAVTLIHPTATVSKRAQIGEGSFVGPGVIINNGSVIGPACIINTGVIVEHDNNIGYAVHLAPGTKTAGRVYIDDYTFIGLGSTILPDIHIGSGAMVGAGSTVVKNIPPKTTVFGYAARKYNKNIYLDAKSDVNSPEKIYVAQPTLPEYSQLDEKFRDIAKSLMLSNFAKYSNLLEEDVERRLAVKKALSFPNCTSALMLAIRALRLKGEVILPSFTFSATGHAVVWNGLIPVFADIDPQTFCVDPDDVERKITAQTSAIVAVHVFGNPADIKRLEAIASKHKLKLIFDSAHAFGSKYHGKALGGFGDIECFSLSSTKVITSAEGGIATSNDVELMQRMHLGRNYGADSDYNCQYIGLNGKMSEFHAAIALESMSLIDKFLSQRNRLAQLYKERLSRLRGISFQRIPEGSVSTFKDFAIIINQRAFGLNRDEIIDKLIERNIYPKKYFFPLHRMKAYQSLRHRAEGLKNTQYIADNIICLPIFSHMTREMLDKICEVLSAIHETANRK